MANISNRKGAKSPFLLQFECLLFLFIGFNVFQTSGVAIKVSYPILMFIMLLSSVIAILYLISNLGLSYIKRFYFLIKMLTRFDALMFLFLMVYLFDLTILPILNGISLTNSINDAGIMVVLFLYFPIKFVFLLGEIQVKKFICFFEACVFLLATWYCFMWIIEYLKPSSYEGFLYSLYSTGVFNVQPVLTGYGMIRIIQSNLVLLGCGFIINFFQPKRNLFIQFILIFLYTFAICATFLKTLWLSVIISVITMLILLLYLTKDKTKVFKKYLIKFAVAITCILVINLIFDNGLFMRVSNLINVNTAIQNSTKVDDSVSSPIKIETPESTISEKVEDKESNDQLFDDNLDKIGTQTSNNARLEQIKMLINAWREKPILGVGFGGYVEGYTRTSEKNGYQFEMTTFALLMKTGLIGVISWILMIINVFYKCFKRFNKQCFLLCSIIGCFVHLIILVQTNPYLFGVNTMSIILYILVLINLKEINYGYKGMIY